MDVKLFSAQHGTPSAVKPVRLPVDTILKIHGRAAREGTSVNNVMRRSIILGLSLLDTEEKKK